MSGLELPKITSGRPFASVAKAGGDHEPAFGSPNPSNTHFWEQSAAPLGSTALIAQTCPPSLPLSAVSPAYTTSPVPSGSTTSGDAETVPPVLKRQICWPVRASNAYR